MCWRRVSMCFGAAVLMAAVWTSGCRAATGREDLVPIALPNGHTIHAELALTKEARWRGLMHRPGLPDDGGMLFVFEDDGFQPITMRNMQFDLDVLYLAPDGSIRQIFESIPHPHEAASDAQIPGVTGRGSYVLELPAGASQRYGLTVGDTVRVSLPSRK